MTSDGGDDHGAERETDDFTGNTAPVRKLWAPYVQAKLGFRNYWYPALSSDELSGDEARGVRLLGEDILLRRVNGRVAAVADRCLHHGVRFSRKPECFTPDTITCWYHGFTYSLLDGMLVEILTEPGSKLCGKIRLKTYPAIEAKGIVFVYVGDGAPNDLADDVPPDFLADDLAVEGIRDEVKANWAAKPACYNNAKGGRRFAPPRCVALAMKGSPRVGLLGRRAVAHGLL